MGFTRICVIFYLRAGRFSRVKLFILFGFAVTGRRVDQSLAVGFAEGGFEFCYIFLCLELGSLASDAPQCFASCLCQKSEPSGSVGINRSSSAMV